MATGVHAGHVANLMFASLNLADYKCAARQVGVRLSAGCAVRAV